MAVKRLVFRRMSGHFVRVYCSASAVYTNLGVVPPLESFSNEQSSHKQLPVAQHTLLSLLRRQVAHNQTNKWVRSHLYCAMHVLNSCLV